MREITDEHKRRATAALHDNLFAKWVGMELVDIQPDVAVIRLQMRDDLRQPHGLLHGGVTATLIDTAMAFAVVTCLGEGEKASTVDLNVYYLRPHIDGPVTCTAKIVKAGRRLFTVSGEVANEEGKLIATAMATYSRV